MGNRSCPPTTRLKRRLAPLWIHLQKSISHGTKLRNLRPGNALNSQRARGMAPSPNGRATPNPSPIGSSKPHVLPSPSEAQPETSEMAYVLGRLQHQPHTHTREQDDAVGRFIQTTGPHTRRGPRQ